MLTAEQIQNNKMQYLGLLSKLNIDLTELTKYLDATAFWTKPASTQVFRAYPGGLVQWQLDFYFELGALCNAYFPGRYTEIDVIKVAIGKELYRTEMYESYTKNVKNDETGRWEEVAAYKTKEVRPTFGDLGLSSYMILKKFVELSDEQALAIIHSRCNSSMPDFQDICRSYPLVTLTHMADKAAQYFN